MILAMKATREPMLSRLSLRIQLLASYVLLLAVSIIAITLALLLFLATRPAPPQPTYQHLAGLVQGLNARELVQDFTPRLRDLSNEVAILRANLSDFAETRDVRVMWILFDDQEQPMVLYDSAGVFMDRAVVSISNDSYISTRLQQTLLPPARAVNGSFLEPNGAEWLFSGVARELPLRQNKVTSLLLLALPRPTIAFSDVLSDFRNDLLPPLLQAGCVGLWVAILLAAYISRNLTRPLGSLSTGATAVAAGDYQHVVPESGPAEIRAVAGAFNQMSAKVRASQQAQRDFLANVSHDLKTPLTSIQGYAQAIMDGATRDPGKAAKIIYDEATRLNRLVVELTDLMRMQSGRLSMRTEALDMGEIATAIGQRLQVVAEGKGITLRLQAAPMPMIAGDGDRMAQVLDNLISNAIKFTPSGGEIVVRTQVHQSGVEVIVQDNGMGIPTADLPKVFERFYQADKARGPQRGTGLGLAIVHEIVTAHGGRIQVYSEGKNKGTTFTIWLPSPHLSTIISQRGR
jgi:signal transduction histidine kinase